MAVILNDLTVNAFRGIEGLKLENLSTINVLVGSNNAGKTSVLEAIYLLSAPYNIGRISGIAFSRNPTNEIDRQNTIIQCVSSLFHKDKSTEETHFSINLEANIQNHLYSFVGNGSMGELMRSSGDTENSFFVSTTISDGDEKIEGKKPSASEYVFVHGDEKPFLPKNVPAYEPVHSLFSSTLFVFGMNYYRMTIRRLSASIIHDKRDSLLALLRSFDPTIENINIINDMIFLDTPQTGTLPLFAYGTGMQKALMLASIIVSTKDGVILIDEIDNAMNISVFREVFPWFMDACRKYHVQAFVTTHSLEAIDAILNCQEENGEDDIRIITLRKTPKTHRTIAKIRTGATARSDREKFEMELRI